MEDERAPLNLRVIVTAGGAGIGRSIVEHFVAAGAHVLATDLDVDALTPLADRAEGRLILLPGDASAEETASSACASMIEAFGGVDVLVNGVGIAGPTAAVEDITLDDWNTSLTVNLTSHFLFSRVVVPAMKEQGSGLIVNISSSSARTGLPLRLPYVVTKAAVLSMTTNMARELGPDGIRVNAILPGAVRGERNDRVKVAKAKSIGIAPEELERRSLLYTSLRTMMDPEDIAEAIGFLASPAAARITGQFLSVDGNTEWEE
ncbi:MAG: SDR family oxidoreductase [Pseudomonadota bacterium]